MSNERCQEVTRARPLCGAGECPYRRTPELDCNRPRPPREAIPYQYRELTYGELADLRADWIERHGRP